MNCFTQGVSRFSLAPFYFKGKRSIFSGSHFYFQYSQGTPMRTNFLLHITTFKFSLHDWMTLKLQSTDFKQRQLSSFESRYLGRMLSHADLQHQSDFLGLRNTYKSMCQLKRFAGCKFLTFSLAMESQVQAQVRHHFATRYYLGVLVKYSQAQICFQVIGQIKLQSNLIHWKDIDQHESICFLLTPHSPTFILSRKSCYYSGVSFLSAHFEDFVGNFSLKWLWLCHIADHYFASREMFCEQGDCQNSSFANFKQNQLCINLTAEKNKTRSTTNVSGAYHLWSNYDLVVIRPPSLSQTWTWIEASQICEQSGGHLAVLNSREDTRNFATLVLSTAIYLQPDTIPMGLLPGVRFECVPLQCQKTSAFWGAE